MGEGNGVASVTTGWTKKKWDLKNNGHNSAEIHQKGKKVGVFRKIQHMLQLQDRHQTFQKWRNG